MKLEEGEKYVEKNGDIHEYLKAVENAEGEIVHVTYNHTEMYADYFTECSVDRLVKEYAPPRPDVEVLGDLIECANECVEYGHVKIAEFGDDDGRVQNGLNNLGSLIKEAEEMKKRMESK